MESFHVTSENFTLIDIDTTTSKFSETKKISGRCTIIMVLFYIKGSKLIRSGNNKTSAITMK
ncbi:hypothetical protein bcgnr5390_35810 [Bacillus luti]